MLWKFLHVVSSTTPTFSGCELRNVYQGVLDQNKCVYTCLYTLNDTNPSCFTSSPVQSLEIQQWCRRIFCRRWDGGQAQEIGCDLKDGNHGPRWPGLSWYFAYPEMWHHFDIYIYISSCHFNKWQSITRKNHWKPAHYRIESKGLSFPIRKIDCDPENYICYSITLYFSPETPDDRCSQPTQDITSATAPKGPETFDDASPEPTPEPEVLGENAAWTYLGGEVIGLVMHIMTSIYIYTHWWS